MRRKGLAALLDGWEPLTEEFPQIADPPPAREDIFQAFIISLAAHASDWHAPLAGLYPTNWLETG